jgi:hypothetical protein
MEEPEIETQLEGLARHHQVNISEHHSQWVIEVLVDQVIVGDNLGFWKSMRVKLFEFMDRNSITIEEYFGLGRRVSLSAEVLPIHINK